MKSTGRPAVAVLLAIAVVASVAAGVGAWALVREHGPQRPEISAYSHGHLTRVGPYRYCNVLNLTDCDIPETEGELPVNSRDPVQLSVPPSIGRAPWWLLRVYEDSADTRDDVLSAGQPARGHHSHRRPTQGSTERNRRAVDDGGRRPVR